MIRFIDIGTQAGTDDEWPREFSFWNTVSDQFIELAGSQMWAHWFEFETDYQADYLAGNPLSYPINRFLALCPCWVFEPEVFQP